MIADGRSRHFKISMGIRWPKPFADKPARPDDGAALRVSRLKVTHPRCSRVRPIMTVSHAETLAAESTDVQRNSTRVVVIARH